MVAANYRSVVTAESEGQTFFAGWRKQPSQTTGAGIWFDLSMSPGNPVPNYYIGTPNVFTAMSQSNNGGIPHGGDVAPMQKFLRILGMQTVLATAVPLPLYLLDYLGFYPFLDESITDEQVLTNITPVPRYPNGEGVQIMPIVVASQAGGQTFKVSYTNSNGVSGRMTPDHIMTTQAVNGTVISSGGAIANSRGPFMALQDGDTGVRKVDSITFNGTGDIGLISLVLVKPIATHYIRGIDAPVETDFLMTASQLPIIKDDAYLNLLALPSGTLATGQILGWIKTLWT